MVFEGIEPETIAHEWATRIGERMRALNLAEDEVLENTRVIQSFCKTAVEMLKEDPTIKLPYNNEVLQLDDGTGHLIIDLFLRGINQSVRLLRMGNDSWESRKNILESSLSWKIFNLAKLLVGLKLAPNPAFNGLLSQDKDLKLMMKHSTDELLRKELGGAA